MHMPSFYIMPILEWCIVLSPQLSFQILFECISANCYLKLKPFICRNHIACFKTMHNQFKAYIRIHLTPLLKTSASLLLRQRKYTRKTLHLFIYLTRERSQLVSQNKSRISEGDDKNGVQSCRYSHDTIFIIISHKKCLFSLNETKTNEFLEIT